MNATVIAPVKTAAEKKADRAAARIAKEDAKHIQAVRDMVADNMAVEAKLNKPAKAPKAPPVKQTAAERKAAAAAKMATPEALNKQEAKLDRAIKKASETIDMEPAEEGKIGYQGPMLALRDRTKRGLYQKAANGQPSCGDEVATLLGILEPLEVIRACLIALNIANPYTHLNVGQQSMNLRNKLRGALKRGEFGMGVLREAVEEISPSKAPE